MTKKNYLKTWENATQILANQFIKKYFGNDASDVYWIAEDIGGVLLVNDYFFNLSDIVDFTRYKYSKKNMFNYYYYALQCSEKNGSPINIKNYLRLKKLNKINI